MSEIRQLSTSDSDFQQQLDQLLAWESVSDASVNNIVNEVLLAIRQRGDAALLEYTNRFDGWKAATA
ncbi:MAG: histidinol dehydrogenase, partial [Sedimenticola sp.]|nr:histidinol dehydrogenase [Sedimenticola sp.]